MSLAQFTDNLGHIGVDLPKDMLKVSPVSLFHVTLSEVYVNISTLLSNYSKIRNVNKAPFSIHIHSMCTYGNLHLLCA